MKQLQRPQWNPFSHRLVACLVVLACCAAWQPFAAAADPERIVAVGDVHGSFDGLTGILEEAKVIDAAGQWIGGSMTLVQLGDLLDRGLQLKEVMSFLMRLQGEADKAGGEVICLLGNHEGMNLLGMVRDVNPDVYEVFADDQSEKIRNDAFTAMTQCLANRAELFGTSDPGQTETREQWMNRFPLGRLEYQKALGPDGYYGKWLRTLEIAVRRGDTVFVHGGLGPALEGQTLGEINTRVADELKFFDRYRATLAKEELILPTAAVTEVRDIAESIFQMAPEAKGNKGRKLRALAKELNGATGVGGWYLVHPDGPLWFRGAAMWEQQEHADQIIQVLEDYKVERMVVGHTVVKNRTVTSRFGGRVLMIDTGMLSEHYKGGRASALEIDGDTVTAIYLEERFRLIDGHWQAVGPEFESKDDAGPRITEGQ